MDIKYEEIQKLHIYYIYRLWSFMQNPVSDPKLAVAHRDCLAFQLIPQIQMPPVGFVINTRRRTGRNRAAVRLPGLPDSNGAQ